MIGILSLRAILLALWAAMGIHSHEAPEVADAIVFATERDPEPPVTGSQLEDALLMAYFAAGESRVQTQPVAFSWDAKAHVSCGVWQEPCGFVRAHTLLDQAEYWLWLLHRGARLCPEAPAAPLSGGCNAAAAKRIAAERARQAHASLEVLLTPVFQAP